MSYCCLTDVLRVSYGCLTGVTGILRMHYACLTDVLQVFCCKYYITYILRNLLFTHFAAVGGSMNITDVCIVVIVGEKDVIALSTIAEAILSRSLAAVNIGVKSEHCCSVVRPRNGTR